MRAQPCGGGGAASGGVTFDDALGAVSGAEASPGPSPGARCVPAREKSTTPRPRKVMPITMLSGIATVKATPVTKNARPLAIQAPRAADEPLRAPRAADQLLRLPRVSPGPSSDASAGCSLMPPTIRPAHPARAEHREHDRGRRPSRHPSRHPNGPRGGHRGGPTNKAQAGTQPGAPAEAPHRTAKHRTAPALEVIGGRLGRRRILLVGLAIFGSAPPPSCRRRFRSSPRRSRLRSAARPSAAGLPSACVSPSACESASPAGEPR